MLLQFRLHYLFVLTVFFAACDTIPKETTINGVVLDKITGEPIAGAIISLTITHDSPQPPYNLEEYAIKTDGIGQFSYSSIDPFRISYAFKSGYIPKVNSEIPDIIKEVVNENIVIKLAPMDGVLEIDIKNTINSTKTIFWGIYSPILDAENDFSNGFAKRDSLEIEPFDTQVRMYNLASEDSISIYWGFTSLPFDIKTLPFHEYVSVTRNDTTTFTISI